MHLKEVFEPYYSSIFTMLLSILTLFQCACYYYVIYVYVSTKSIPGSIQMICALTFVRFIHALQFASKEYPKDSWCNSKNYTFRFLLAFFILSDIVPMIFCYYNRKEWQKKRRRDQLQLHRLDEQNESKSKETAQYFRVHNYFQSLPAALTQMGYLWLSHNNQFKIMSIISIFITFIFSNIRSIPLTININKNVQLFHWLSYFGDSLRFLLTFTLSILLIHYGIHNTYTVTGIYWSAIIFLIQCLIKSILTAIWIYCYFLWNIPPHQYIANIIRSITQNYTFSCLLLLFIFLPFYLISSILIIIFLAFIVEIICLSIPFVIYYDCNQDIKYVPTTWNSISSFLNKSINKTDYKLRLYIINYVLYSFFNESRWNQNNSFNHRKTYNIYHEENVRKTLQNAIKKCFCVSVFEISDKHIRNNVVNFNTINKPAPDEDVVRWNPQHASLTSEASLSPPQLSDWYSSEKEKQEQLITDKQYNISDYLPLNGLNISSYRLHIDNLVVNLFIICFKLFRNVFPLRTKHQSLFINDSKLYTIKNELNYIPNNTDDDDDDINDNKDDTDDDDDDDDDEFDDINCINMCFIWKQIGLYFIIPLFIMCNIFALTYPIFLFVIFSVYFNEISCVVSASLLINYNIIICIYCLLLIYTLTILLYIFLCVKYYVPFCKQYWYIKEKSLLSEEITYKLLKRTSFIYMKIHHNYEIIQYLIHIFNNNVTQIIAEFTGLMDIDNIVPLPSSLQSVIKNMEDYNTDNQYFNQKCKWFSKIIDGEKDFKDDFGYIYSNFIDANIVLSVQHATQINFD